MRYVDSNILIRLATKDNLSLYDKALQILKSSDKNSLIVTEAVLVEVFFILEFNSTYRIPRKVVHETLSTMLLDSTFSLEEDLRQAMNMFGIRPKLDITDCILAVKAGNKQKNIVTFDKDLLKILA